MWSLDLLYVALAVGFLVFVSFCAYALYQLGLVLKALRLTVNETREIVEDIRQTETSLRLGIFSLASWLFRPFDRRGGE